MKGRMSRAPNVATIMEFVRQIAISAELLYHHLYRTFLRFYYFPNELEHSMDPPRSRMQLKNILNPVANALFVA
jgi:hypothetical protein